MHAGFARRREVDHNVALAVEAARVAHVGVVVGRDVDIVVLGPADALEVNRHRRAGRARRRRHADDACLDHEVHESERAVAVAQRDAVQSPDVVRDAHRHVEHPVAADGHSREDVLLRRKAIAANPIADRGLPHEIQRRPAREAGGSQSCLGFDRALRRRHPDRRVGDVDLRGGQRLGLIRLRGCRRHRGAPWRRAKSELRSGQIRDRRLFVVQVRLALVAGVDLDRMIPGRSRRAKPGHGRAAGASSGHPANLVVVPVHRPRAFHRPPPEPLDRELDRRPHRTGRWRQLEALRHLYPVLRNRAAIHDRHHVMHAAVVLRDGELRLEATVPIDREPSERRGGVRVLLSPEMVVVLDHPAARDRCPLQFDVRTGRQSRSRRGDDRTDDWCVVGERQPLNDGIGCIR